MRRLMFHPKIPKCIEILGPIKQRAGGYKATTGTNNLQVDVWHDKIKKKGNDPVCSELDRT
jgi:hypothetical protein